MVQYGPRLASQIALTALRSSSSQELCIDVCNLIASEMGPSLVWIADEDPEKGILRFLHAAGPAAEFVDRIVLPLSGDLSLRDPSIAALTSRQANVGSYSEAEYLNLRRNSGLPLRLRSSFNTPVEFAHAPRAVLSALSEDPDFFSVDVVDTLNFVAEVIKLTWPISDDSAIGTIDSRSLRTLNSIYQRVAEASPIGIATIDQNARVTTANPAFLALLERNWDEVVGRSIDDLIKSEGHPTVADAAHNYTTSPLASLRTLATSANKTGETNWLSISFSRAGSVRVGDGYIIFAEDSTPAVRHQQELERVRELIRLAAAHSPIMVFALDSEDRLILSEGGLSFPSAERLRIGDQPVISYSSHDSKAEFLHNSVRQGSRVDGEIVLRDDRALRFWEGPITGHESRQALSGGVAIDVTDLESDKEDLLRRSAVNQLLAELAKHAMRSTSELQLFEGVVVHLKRWIPESSCLVLVGSESPDLQRNETNTGTDLVLVDFDQIAQAGSLIDDTSVQQLSGSKVTPLQTLANGLVPNLKEGEGDCFCIAIRAHPKTIALVTLWGGSTRRDLAHILESVSAIVSTSLQRLESFSRLQEMSRIDLATGMTNLRGLRDRIESDAKNSFMLIRARISQTMLAIKFGTALVQNLRVEFIQKMIATVREVYNKGVETYIVDRGDFLFLLPYIDQTAAQLTLSQLEQIMAVPLEVAGMSISIEIRLSLITPEGASLDDRALRDLLIRDRDGSPTDGMNSTHLQGPTGHGTIPTEARRLALAMTRALETNAFTLHYQVKIDSASRNVVGTEALLRWNDPELGRVGPDIFIPLSEKIGLIHPITDFVIGEAAATASRIRSTHGSLPISINVSAKSLTSFDLIGRLNAQIKGMGLPTDLIQIELTETAAFRSAGPAAHTLAALAEAGYLIAIDDFGTGYSSIMHLRSLSIHQLKIDKSFVLRMTESSTSLAIVRSVIDLGRTLGIEVIAEGVESEQHVDLLTQYGCPTLQGFYFAPPMSERDLMVWLKDYGARQHESQTL